MVTVDVVRVPPEVLTVETLVELVAPYRATRSGSPVRLWVAVSTGPLVVLTVDDSGVEASASA